MPIQNADNYDENKSWIADPTFVLDAQKAGILFSFRQDLTFKGVHAPLDAAKQNIGRATKSGTLVPNNGFLVDNGIKKRYVHRYFETHESVKPAGTTYTGTHYTRTHKLRPITATRHTYKSTLVMHINNQHSATPIEHRGVTISTTQYTDVVGTDMTPQSINLDWDGAQWVIPDGERQRLMDNRGAEPNYQGNYIIENDQIRELTNVYYVGLQFDDTGSIVAGLNSINTNLQGSAGLKPPLTAFGSNTVSADAQITDLVDELTT